MPSLFEAYITNLGKYAEGELVGETLKFPTTAEEVQALLKHIGVDGIRYQEFFITSFDGDVVFHLLSDDMAADHQHPRAPEQVTAHVDPVFMFLGHRIMEIQR